MLISSYSPAFKQCKGARILLYTTLISQQKIPSRPQGDEMKMPRIFAPLLWTAHRCRVNLALLHPNNSSSPLSCLFSCALNMYLCWALSSISSRARALSSSTFQFDHSLEDICGNLIQKGKNSGKPTQLHKYLRQLYTYTNQTNVKVKNAFGSQGLFRLVTIRWFPGAEEIRSAGVSVWIWKTSTCWTE